MKWDKIWGFSDFQRGSDPWKPSSLELDGQIVEFGLPDHVFLIEVSAGTVNNSGVGDRI